MSARLAAPLAVLLGAAACGRSPEPPAPAEAGAPPVPVPASPPSADEGSGPPPPGEVALEPGEEFQGSKRLTSILERARAEGAPWQVEVGLDDLKGRFLAHLRDLRDTMAPHLAKEAGLPAPEVREFDAEDKAERSRAKWLQGGRWNRGSSLPRDGSGVDEAWSRVYGSRAFAAGDTLIMESGVPADKWRRTLWQPRRKRWAFFTEADERAILAALEAGSLAKLPPDAHNSARFECERLQPAVEKALAAGRDPSGYRRNMKAAIVRAYDAELKLEAARYLLSLPE